MPASLQSWLPTLIFVPLVAFGLYRRFKRTFGPQTLSVPKLAARMGLMLLFSVLLALSVHDTKSALLAGGGAVVGIGLALFGLVHTRFERSGPAKLYTPNGWIGLVVTALFVGRLVARMFTLYVDRAAVAAAAGAAPFSGMSRSPLTVGIFFVMAAYYIVYYAGVLLKARRL